MSYYYVRSMQHVLYHVPYKSGVVAIRCIIHNFLRSLLHSLLYSKLDKSKDIHVQVIDIHFDV